MGEAKDKFKIFSNLVLHLVLLIQTSNINLACQNLVIIVRIEVTLVCIQCGYITKQFIALVQVTHS
jgi:hypothetical protein